MIELYHAWFFGLVKWLHGDHAKVATIDPHSSAPSPAFPHTTTKSLIKMIAFAETRSAKVIGLACVPPCEVPDLASQLATTYARVGKKALFVDANRDPNEATGSTQTIGGIPCTGDLDADKLAAAFLGSLKEDTARIELTEVLNMGANEFDVVVINLPRMVKDGQPAPLFIASGPACNIVFLFCLSGVATRGAVAECVDICRVAGVELGGLVLCDWELAGHDILE